ncbi:alanine racemase [Propionibacteriaceae bacterium Y2011]
MITLLPGTDAEPAARQWPRLGRVTAGLPAPLAALDLAALGHNAGLLTTLAAGTRLRLVTKSVRCRELIKAIDRLDGWHGVMASSLAEAIWLVRTGTSSDVLVGYPTVDRRAIAELVADEELASRIAISVDGPEHLDLIDAVTTPGRRADVRICLDLDVGLTIGRWRFGAHRSAVATAADAESLARAVSSRPGFRLVGVLAYEAQLAGVPDRGNGTFGDVVVESVLRQLKQRSRRDLRSRRAEMVAAVGRVVELEFVNGGGTGSLTTTVGDPSITEVGLGSGLFGPHLFDRYDDITPAPAVGFALDVTRQHAADVIVCHGGGWVASGPPRSDRAPQPVHPTGLRFVPGEGPGETQTPLRLRSAADTMVGVGDRVWFRHAKSGELSDRVTQLAVVRGEELVAQVPTYRGEGKAFW